MERFLSNERGALAVDWVVLTGGAMALSLGAIGLIGSHLGNRTDDISVALADDAALAAAIASFQPGFDIGAYPFLTQPGGTPGWRDTIAGFHTDEEFYGWLTSDHGNARHPENDAHTRKLLSDDYALTYAAADARGIDLSAYQDPYDLREELIAELGP